ncbi:MAG: DUF3179 domain-containing protein [Deltaproteobacteria bacterium]|jgi:hypothetical protein|nr:DUF3179 domain-containing protein [Deltaproteobacteria bacterium]
MAALNRFSRSFSVWAAPFCLFCLLCCPLLGPGRAGAAETLPSEVPGLSLDDLRFMYNEMFSIGSRGSAGAVYRPTFVRVSDADLSMDNREPVFIVHYPGGLTRIYPQSILVWHEIVNDVVPDPNPGQSDPSGYGRYGGGRAETSGNSYTISYSPLSGSVVAFRSKAGRYPTVFGSEGKLINGNSVLFDQASGSLWSQLLAVCIEGPLVGRRLERYPVYWARWGGTKERYPQAEVLSRATGYKRTYGRDPYGSYYTPGNYYDDTRVYFPLSRRSDRLPPKERILGLEMESIYGAISVAAVRDSRALNQTLGIFKLVALYDEEMDRVRVFESKLSNGTILNFQFFENKFMDTNTRSEWNSDGECVYGRMRGTALKPVLAIDSMWFAWFAFHPDTQILGAEAPPPRRGPDIPY